MDWTAAHVEELQRLYPDPETDTNKLAAHFGVTPNALRHVARRFGVRRPARNTWTAERTRFLRDNIETMSYPELAGRLGLAVVTVRTKATLLKVQRPQGRRLNGWTTERLARLRAEVGEVGTKEMADRLGMSEGTVRRKTRELELPAPRRRRWTEQRVAEFLAAYETTPKEVLAERYGLTPKSVMETASRLKPGPYDRRRRPT